MPWLGADPSDPVTFLHPTPGGIRSPTATPCSPPSSEGGSDRVMRSDELAATYVDAMTPGRRGARTARFSRRMATCILRCTARLPAADFYPGALQGHGGREAEPAGEHERLSGAAMRWSLSGWTGCGPSPPGNRRRPWPSTSLSSTRAGGSPTSTSCGTLHPSGRPSTDTTVDVALSASQLDDGWCDADAIVGEEHPAPAIVRPIQCGLEPAGIGHRPLVP